MTPNKLPPLPKPSYCVVVRHFEEISTEDYFTADDMHAYAAEALRQSQSLPAGAVAALVGKWREHEHAGNSSWGDGYMAAMKDCAFDLEQALQADAREKGEAVAFRWLRNGEPASRWMDGQPTERQFKAAKDCEDIAIWSVQYAYMLPATQPAQASESMDLPQELLDRVDVLRKKAEANEGVKSQASEKDNEAT